MKKLLFSLLTISCGMLAWADGQEARITSTPSPAISNKPLEVTITTGNIGPDVYCYTWCKNVNGSEKTPSWSWDGVHTSKFKMTGSDGTYKLTITNIQEFYELTDDELSGLTQLGFIAKTPSGNQTQDLVLDVEQGRRDAYSGGEGTQENPFILKTTADLMNFANTPGDWAAGTYLKMESNIEIPDLRSTIGTPATPFRASFDGNGHVIGDYHFSNDKFGVPSGLFGVISGGEVKNLGVVNSTVYGSTDVAILVGQLESGVISRCFTAGRVGGVSICVGGLVGENVSGTILNCYSGVFVENANDYATGGLVGKNRGTISNTYACGDVIGFDYVGGLVGANYGTVKNSFALNGSVFGPSNFVARFGGNNNSQNTASDTYSWEDMSSAYAWQQHGHHADMKKSSIFRNQEQFKSLSGWDFDNIWEWRTEGDQEYPVLKGLLGQSSHFSEQYFAGTTGVVDLISGDNSFLKVGPNPTHGELRVISSEEIARYEIYSLSGTLTMEGTPDATEIILDLSGQSNGFYILHTVTAGGEERINKIIKK